MPELVLDSTTTRQVVEEVAQLLKFFHEAEERKEGGFESVSRRGQLGGFRDALGIIVGRKATSEILEAVREETELPFPHMGPVADNGTIYNVDFEAALDL
jgi:hypothetical protein